ncbi:SpoIID/LytB domain-containing protein [Myxacorys almedinensis A]|uniref:SpoIID/LytB domain-containing protein n=1 Tax=Myxacorys almedinensis A TaxID=2690445 RepID=A0A8J8CGX4_9CYAN|nr:SpoIID/LytB domain-containing protein [Myxacorys almedinensis A]
MCVALVAGLIEIATQPLKATAQQDVPLQIGIVQRFGEKQKDTLLLKAASGDRVTVRFAANGKPETVSAPDLKLEIANQPIPQPELYERVVFSTHRSFETAEAQAQQWKAQGIDVELAQPNRWEVWAKRSTYNTPLLRRLLIQSLEAKGIKNVRLDSRVLTSTPRVSWVLNGRRYATDRLDISTGKGIMFVDRERDDVPNRLYGGAFRIQPNAYGNYSLVNVVALETYLRGVVPNEIGGWAAQPVLEAQAILARTYVLRNLRRFVADDYQLCATTQCQVYYGLGTAVEATDRAIAATRGLVLTYQNELVDALYSSTSGGVTAAFNDIWSGWDRPYLTAVIDSTNPVWNLGDRSLADEKNFRAFMAQKTGFNEDKAELFRWRYANSLEQLNQELREYLKSVKHPLASFKTIRNIQVTQRSVGGRILKAAIATDAGAIVLEKDDILNVFSKPASTLFYVEPMVDQNRALKGFAFVGGGFGHGVGLSQMGTYRLGAAGWSSPQILNFYFPGTQLQPINQSITLWKDRSTSEAQTSQNQ